MATDRELLELAAKAAGIDFEDWPHTSVPGTNRPWNPLTDDGDAFRLAVKLAISPGRATMDGAIEFVTVGYGDGDEIWVQIDGDPYAATRRAIVRAAAEIGKELK